MATIKILMVTANPKKAEEYRQAWGRYAIKPVIYAASEEEKSDFENLAARLIEDGTANVVISEISNIHAPDSQSPMLNPKHMDPAVNRSTAMLFRQGSNGLEVIHYKREVRGYITLTAPRSQGAFEWDAIFAPISTGMTYDQTARLGLKNSARDLVLADIFAELMRYERMVNLNFHPLASTRPVDFSITPADHLDQEKWLTTDEFKGSLADKLLGSALQDGAFFRGSQSRRERNYWLPGLNGGIPLVPKKDDIHELTFQFHDMMHMLMPDLVYDGSCDEMARRVYMVHRMIGEAVSLVAADAIFVGTMADTGCDYDFKKRRILPLFRSMSQVDLKTKEGFREAAWANAQFALLGDDSVFLKLGADPGALQDYKAKYERFFAEDYRWTSMNFERMSTDASLFQKWSSGMSDAFDAANVMTVSGFCSALNERGQINPYDLPDLIKAVFDLCWKRFIERAIDRDLPFSGGIDKEAARSNAFLRYILGQITMYTRYAHAPAVTKMGNLLRDEILHAVRTGTLFNQDDIIRIRSFHELAVDHLFDMSAISAEDRRIFKEVVPVFAPFFVFYESRDNNQGVKEVLATLFGSQVSEQV